MAYTPDTRFDEVGHYKTNLIMSGEDAENLKQKIDAAIQKSIALAKEKAKGKNIKTAAAPYEDDTNDDGRSYRFHSI